MTSMFDKIKELSTYSKNNSDLYGEVFTPFPLINQMCDSLPREIWSDPTKTFLDPCAGKGQMPAVILERLMVGLMLVFPDETIRYKHIMEKQIYMAEYQRQSARDIESIFNPTGELHLNLYVGDTLRMPKNFWDLSYEKRLSRYPQHHVSDNTPDDKMVYAEVTSEPLF